MRAHLAPALVTLRAEINAAHPHRDRSSDGWIGDVSHSARLSDHNPEPPSGIVRAIDVDVTDIDLAHLTYVVVNDARTANVITNGQIWVRGVGWRAYAGSNKHTQHIHISVRKHGPSEGSTAAWGYQPASAAPSTKKEEEMNQTQNELLVAVYTMLKHPDYPFGFPAASHRALERVVTEVGAVAAKLDAIAAVLDTLTADDVDAIDLEAIGAAGGRAALDALGDALAGIKK